MAEFVCKFGTPSGQVMRQTEQAASEAELRLRLVGQGYLVYSDQPKDLVMDRLRSLGTKRISADDFLIFNQQFLTLSKSGLPLQKSIDLLARQTRSEALRTALQAVQERVRGGAMLSEAFE